MANIIQLKPCLISPDGLFKNQQNLPSQSKVLTKSINYAYPCTRISSVNCASNLVNYSDKLQLQEHPSRFMMNHSLINVEDANTLIRNYVEDGLFEDAVGVYLKLLEYSYPVENFRYFPCLIKAFGGLYDINKGRQIHGHVMKLGARNDTYIVNSLLGAYLKLGETKDAVQLFEKMSKRDTVSWNTMISGFSEMGDYEGSLVLLKLMIEECGNYPNRVACLSALSSIASIQSLTHGQEIHAFVIKRGLDVDDFLASGLIDMYMKCRKVRYAERIFRSSFVKETIIRNTVIWNVMISGYVFNECLYQGLHIFLEMLEMGLKPDHSTIVATLVLCSHLSNLTIGKQINGLILSNGLQSDVRVETALLDMYFRCGDPRTGLQVFYKSKNKNLVMWGAVITNSAQCGYTIEALNLVSHFMLYGSVDSILLLSALRLCSSVACLSIGKELHGLAIKIGIDSDAFVGGALVDMYAKCRDVESSEKAFYNINYRDLVSWNSLLSGYAQNDFTEQALKAFRDMQLEKILPNNVTISCMLSVCANLSFKMLCKEVYSYVLRRGLDSDILVCNSLITTFAKCGDINGAWVVFKKMPVKNKVSWNSIILGFGLHGLIDKMSTIYEEMKDARIKPDHATFTAVLSACSHAGRLEMGLTYFQSMIDDYKLEPCSMVDLLGRAGHLKQAYDLVLAMPCVPDDRIWGSLLGSCKIYGNEKLAELVASHIFNLDPTSVGYRILLANLYDDFGKWNESTRVRSQVKEMRFKKQPGCSWIEVNNNVHVFVAGDHSHHKKDEIYSTVASLTMEIRKEGYIPHRALDFLSN